MTRPVADRKRVREDCGPMMGLASTPNDGVELYCLDRHMTADHKQEKKTGKKWGQQPIKGHYITRGVEPPRKSKSRTEDLGGTPGAQRGSATIFARGCPPLVQKGKDRWDEEQKIDSGLDTCPGPVSSAEGINRKKRGSKPEGLHWGHF